MSRKWTGNEELIVKSLCDDWEGKIGVLSVVYHVTKDQRAKYWDFVP